MSVTSRVTCYSTSDKLRGVSIFIETQDKMIHKVRGVLTSETLEQKLRLRDKVKLKAQLLLQESLYTVMTRSGVT
jgi:hypothetical protein